MARLWVPATVAIFSGGRAMELAISAWNKERGAFVRSAFHLLFGDEMNGNGNGTVLAACK
jgi:hypothetical protein